MSDTTAERRRRWEAEGYVAIEGAVGAAQLARLRAAFDRWSVDGRPQWLERVARGEASPTWFDIPEPHEKDEVFLELADHPSWFGLVCELAGDVTIAPMQARTVPCWPVSYTAWHPDRGDGGPRQVKVQVYVDDVPPGGGEFAYVPGSHRRHPETHYRPGRNEGTPGHLRLPGPAGTAILFDNRGLHTAMDNATDVPRRSVIFSYAERPPGGGDSDRFAAIADRLTTPARRRLFGLR